MIQMLGPKHISNPILRAFLKRNGEVELEFDIDEPRSVLHVISAAVLGHASNTRFSTETWVPQLLSDVVST